jgi:hypothetical protein
MSTVGGTGDKRQGISFFHHLVEVGARGEGDIDRASGGGRSISRAEAIAQGSSSSSSFFS